MSWFKIPLSKYARDNVPDPSLANIRSNSRKNQIPKPKTHSIEYCKKIQKMNQMEIDRVMQRIVDVAIDYIDRDTTWDNFANLLVQEKVFSNIFESRTFIKSFNEQIVNAIYKKKTNSLQMSDMRSYFE